MSDEKETLERQGYAHNKKKKKKKFFVKISNLASSFEHFQSSKTC